MVHILGVNLVNTAIARRAITKFYGVGEHIAHRLCARLQIHDKCKIQDLTPAQLTALASFLSSPSTSPAPPRYPLAHPDYVPPPINTSVQELQAKFDASKARVRLLKAKQEKNGAPKFVDFLNRIKVESELKREVRENIAHQRMIGSYVGKRHAMNLPVRGQNTQNNARTAKKLNRLNR